MDSGRPRYAPKSAVADLGKQMPISGKPEIGPRNDAATGAIRSIPQLLARQPCAFHQRFELRPHYRGVYTTIEGALGEATVGARDHVLAPEQIGKPRDAFG